MAHLHDTGYKYFFSHADLVRKLPEVFSPPGVTELLDGDGATQIIRAVRRLSVAAVDNPRKPR